MTKQVSAFVSIGVSTPLTRPQISSHFQTVLWIDPILTSPLILIITLFSNSQRAKQAASAVKKGAHTTRKQKVWTKVTFKLPKTQTLARKPIAVKKAVKKESTWDKYTIIKNPLSSESAIKTIEDHNTLVFVVDKRARKPAIKKACQELYSIKVQKVNTLITPKGNKKAYVVLSK